MSIGPHPHAHTADPVADNGDDARGTRDRVHRSLAAAHNQTVYVSAFAL